MATRHTHKGQPSALSSMLEARVFLEAASLPYSLPLLMQAPHGDGLDRQGLGGEDRSAIGQRVGDAGNRRAGPPADLCRVT